MKQYTIGEHTYAAESMKEAYRMAEIRSKEVADAEADREWKESLNPTLGMSMTDKLRAGGGRGLSNVARQLGNITGLVDDESLQEYQRLDAPLMNTIPGQIGNVIGETAAVAPAGLAAQGVIRPVASAILPKALQGLAPVAGYAAEGATEGAILGGPGNRGGGAVVGATIGGGMGAAGNMLVKGATPSPNAQTIMNEGVDLTPGQMNPGGLMDAVEESASGRMIPTVKGAREHAQLGQFQALINRSRPRDTTEIPLTNMSQMTDDLYKQFNSAYDEVKGFPAMTMGMHAQMRKRIEDGHITKDRVEAETKWIDSQMTKYGDGLEMKTEDLMDLRSEIRTRMREKSRKADPDFDEIRMLDGVEDAVTNRLERALPRRERMILRTTDKQYGNYKVVEDISFRVGDRGQPTPFLMSQAVKRAQQSKGKYARGGGGKLRELTAVGADVFAENTPKTGMGLAIPALGAMMGGGAGGPMGIAAGAALPGAIAAGLSGTSVGRRGYKGELPIQQILQQADIPAVPALMRAFGVQAGVNEFN